MIERPTTAAVGPLEGNVLHRLATADRAHRRAGVGVGHGHPAGVDQLPGEQVLLGLSAGRIAPLHVLKEPVHLPDAEPASPEFAQRLMELLGKDQKDKP